jgi:hypothetical protein
VIRCPNLVTGPGRRDSGQRNAASGLPTSDSIAGGRGSGLRIRTPDRGDAPGRGGNVPGDGPHEGAGLGDGPPGRAAAVPATAMLCGPEQRLEGTGEVDAGSGVNGPDAASELA